MDFKIVKGDLLPKLRATLQNADGTPIDLTGLDSSAITFSFQSGSLEHSGPCDIIDAAAGIVEYTWATGDTDVSGLYFARFAVDFDGSKESFPNNDWITFEIIAEVPTTSPLSATPLTDFIEPVRAFLGDFDDNVRLYEDQSIIRCVRSLVRCGEVEGYALSPNLNAILPEVLLPKVFAVLTYKTCKAFVNPNTQSYSYRTRALSESFGDNRTFLFELENAIHNLENGEMFSSYQTFYGWINAITGINLWAHLTDLKTNAPVAQISVGRDGIKVTAS